VPGEARRVRAGGVDPRDLAQGGEEARGARDRRPEQAGT
jgi:hypothetical protein